jgi:hypothetical protein
MKIKTLLLGTALLAFQTNRAQLLHADFNETETVSDYVSSNPLNRLFNAIGSTGTGVQVSISQEQLHFSRSGTNTGSFSRTTNFSNTPNALAIQIKLKVADNTSAQTTAAILQVGAGFSTNNSAESNANVHSRLGINFSANTGEFSLRDLGSSTNTTALTGAQTLLWVINNSGSTLSYKSPSGTAESLANDTWDVWAGTTKLFDDKSALTSSQTLDDFKFVLSSGSGKVSFDQIIIDLPSSLNHFRSSTTTGNWYNPSHWESSIDSSNWSAASSLPSGISASVFIKTNQQMLISGSSSAQFCSANHLIIANNASLHIGSQGDGLSQNQYQTFSLIKAGNYVNAQNYGILQVNENAVFQCKGSLQNNATMLVKSSAAGTGQIGNSKGGTITGIVSVERFIPAVARRNRSLCSPISNNTLEDWRGEIYITGNGSGTTLGSTNSNGFDATLTNNPSVFWYDETVSGSILNGWQAANHISNALVPGRGYKVMIRGDRSDLGRINGTNNTQNAVTLVSTGTLTQGDFTFPTSNITYSGSSTDDGWCFIGNPYASNINWNAASGWQRNNVDAGAIAIWNPQTNSYAYSVSTSGGANPSGLSINGGSPIIAPHQAFFVRTTGANPSLSCNENIKSTSSTQALLKNDAQNLIKLSLLKDDFNRDEAIIRFNPNYSESEIDFEDLAKFKNPVVNIGSGQNPKRWLALNALPLFLTTAFSIPIYTEISDLDSGLLQLEIKNRDQFDELVLTDLLNKKHFYLQESFVQKFDFKTTDTHQPRFLLTGKHKMAAGNESLESLKISVYPNPVQEVLTIQLPFTHQGIGSVFVCDAQGKMVLEDKTATNSTKQLQLSSLQPGIYVLKIWVDGQVYFSKIVKQ